jgi:hypothetical protein
LRSGAVLDVLQIIKLFCSLIVRKTTCMLNFKFTAYEFESHFCTQAILIWLKKTALLNSKVKF